MICNCLKKFKNTLLHLPLLRSVFQWWKNRTQTNETLQQQYKIMHIQDFVDRVYLIDNKDEEIEELARELK